MHSPTKKTFYILIACIISLVAISFAKSQTDLKIKPISLLTSSSTNNQNTTNTNFDFEQTATNPQVDINNANLTDEFSKSFFAKYYVTGNGSSLSDLDSQNLVKEAVDAYKSINLENTTHFSLQNLTIVKSNEQNLRNFANTFITKEGICLNNIKKTAQETQDPIKTGNLYKKCAEDLVKIPITQELNQNYLAVVNNFYLMGEKIYSLEAAKADPLKALIIMKEIGTIESNRTVLYTNISSLIKKSGIIFSNEEPGKAWVGIAQ